MFKLIKQLMIKKYNSIKDKVNKLYILLIYFLFVQNSFSAAVDTSDGTWGGLYSKILGLFTGTSGAIISLLALGACIFGALFTQHKVIAVVAGITIPLTIAFGPAIFVGLSGAIL